METALNGEEIIEYFDEPDVLIEKVTQLAEFVRGSNHFVCYTGAGISTASGISDFRGPEGVWTLKAKGIKPKPSISKSEAKPTLTDMSLVALMNNNLLKFLVSQNCDGLHLKSGILPSQISELHGNTNVEACAGCGTVYYRSFPVRSLQNKQRLTGKRCEKCNIPLRYTTVAFGQSMPDLCIHQASVHSKKADLSLCLGTSMRVQPACDLPVAGKKKNKNHKLVIANLQKTPYDDDCAIRIFAKVDQVMELLMKLLNIPIPIYMNLELAYNPEWLKTFQLNWKFRKPNVDWFTGDIDQSDEILDSCCLQKPQVRSLNYSNTF